MKRTLILGLVFLVFALPSLADSGIAWFGEWSEGLADAKASNKPILLVSGAPHCHNVSGIW